MSTETIAKDLAALCMAGKFDEAGETFWADDVVSVEPRGDMAVSRGKDAAREKGKWWAGAHEVHGIDVAGPYVNGDRFTLRFTIDLTVKQSGARVTMDEIGLYTLKDDKIAEERFFYLA